jgi:hypothetical protein
MKPCKYSFVGTAYIQDMMDTEAFANDPKLRDFTIL